MKMHCYLHSTPLKEVEARVSTKLRRSRVVDFFVCAHCVDNTSVNTSQEQRRRSYTKRSIFCRAPLRANDRCRRISGNEQATPGVSKGLVSPRLDTADFHS